jgi:mono/diheme cytochrome c family protein
MTCLYVRYQKEEYTAVPGAKDFTVFSKIHENTPVELGPFYLVWKNLGDAVLMAQGPNYWPYQLTTVDLVRFADKAVKLAPPATAKQDAKEGFALFRKTCLACHTLNGEGGQTSGVELNRPVNVTRYWKKEWLSKWIASPKSVRETSKMPDYESESGYQLPADVRAKQIQQIIAYLESMAK